MTDATVPVEVAATAEEHGAAMWAGVPRDGARGDVENPQLPAQNAIAPRLPVAHDGQHDVAAALLLSTNDQPAEPVIDLRTPNGDVDVDRALQTIIDEHAPAMFRVAKSIVRDASLAEDVVQESIVKAWRSLPGFRGDSSLRSWALRITHNTAISTLRKRREDVRDPQTLPEEHANAVAGPDRQVAGRMMVDELWVALDRLDDVSRTIVILREIEGLSYEEIADALQLALPTIKTRLFRARRQLATSLSEWT